MKNGLGRKGRGYKGTRDKTTAIIEVTESRVTLTRGWPRRKREAGGLQIFKM